MTGYLNTGKKSECFGCESCTQICAQRAIDMKEDVEGFRYPIVNNQLCVNCGLCHKVCPCENAPLKSQEEPVAFGGYSKDEIIREGSTSGGAFSAIVEAWCDKNYVIFGAKSEGVNVYHTYISDKSKLAPFRKSKYVQSSIKNTYTDAKHFLNAGKKVLFSGTPCQIAGLKAFLGNKEHDNLLTVEVVCEGVPSPLFIRKYNDWMQSKYGTSIKLLDYRFKNGNRWDFEVMFTSLENGHCCKIDRWFNPFWSIWLQHLMSRPSCYSCPFTTLKRVADITLGDLWGAHIYCPELYGNNGGSSLIVCNTAKGKETLACARENMFGHNLDFQTAVKYQSPMRTSIDENDQRQAFMKDIEIMSYKLLCKKWAPRPSLKLLYSKYVWGNRQQVLFWKFTQKLFNKY